MRPEYEVNYDRLAELLRRLTKWKDQCIDAQLEINVLSRYGTEEVFGNKNRHDADKEFRKFCGDQEQELADLEKAISLLESSLIKIRDRSLAMDRFS